MNIKVCGITRGKDLEQLVALGADYAGFIFYEKSPRYIIGKMDASAVTQAGSGIKKVGVFVNAPLYQVQQTIKDYQLDLVQLHGNESITYCQAVRLSAQVIKAFRVGNNPNFHLDAAPFMPVVDYFLFDTAHPQFHGGSGVQFDWKMLDAYRLHKPFFLSGGIGPKDVALLKAFQHPYLHAYDINSKFETAPGEKDMQKVAAFIEAVKAFPSN